MSNQLGIPVDVRPEEVARKQSLGSAIELCAELAGFALDKELQQELGVDKAQFSRWLSDQEGVKWSKLTQLMDKCGNDAPILWMLHMRGYDIASIRRKETEIEKENRELREDLAAARRLLVGRAA